MAEYYAGETCVAMVIHVIIRALLKVGVTPFTFQWPQQNIRHPHPVVSPIFVCGHFKDGLLAERESAGTQISCSLWL